MAATLGVISILRRVFFWMKKRRRKVIGGRVDEEGMLFLGWFTPQPGPPAAGPISLRSLIEPNFLHSPVVIVEPSRHPTFMPFNKIPPADGIDGFCDCRFPLLLIKRTQSN
jgi:hypothetical protein